MNTTFAFRNVDEGEQRFQDYADPKLEDLAEQYPTIEAVHVSVNAQRNWRTVDLTVQVHGALLRAEERNDEMRQAFDRALARMQRQLLRIKDRQRDFGHESLRTLAGTLGAGTVALEPEAATAVAEQPIRIVRSKTHSLKPMTPEEAALQMELLGHDFYVFMDGTSEQLGVVYKRREGNYGLIEAEEGEEE